MRPEKPPRSRGGVVTFHSSSCECLAYLCERHNTDLHGLSLLKIMPAADVARCLLGLASRDPLDLFNGAHSEDVTLVKLQTYLKRGTDMTRQEVSDFYADPPEYDAP